MLRTGDIVTTPVPAEPDQSGEIESAVYRLLDAYSGSVRFARELPVLGRCRVSGGRSSTRWVARFWTLLYVQTHIRSSIRRLIETVDNELLALRPAEASGLRELRGRLGTYLESLMTWGRLKSFVARLPPLTAAVPVVTGALAASVTGETVSARPVLRAAVVLGVTAVVVYALFLWPSVRLGFRVKRAIFSAGTDLRHPFWYSPGELRWEGLPKTPRLFENERLIRWPGGELEYLGGLWGGIVKTIKAFRRSSRSDEVRSRFPSGNVYEAEGELFRLLGARPVTEPPFDLVLSLPLYLTFALAVGMWVGTVNAVIRGQWSSPFPTALVVTVLLTALWIQLMLQVMRNYRVRSRMATVIVDWRDWTADLYREGVERFGPLILLMRLRIGPAALMQAMRDAARERPEDFPQGLLADAEAIVFGSAADGGDGPDGSDQPGREPRPLSTTPAAADPQSTAPDTTE